MNVFILTKSNLILRDLELLKEFPKKTLELLHNYFISSVEVDRPRKSLNKAFKTGSYDPYTTFISKC